MSFWRKEVIDFALSHETRLHLEEQLSWIQREPGNARPYYNLAQLYRIENKRDEALGLLLEAVRLQPDLPEAHAALAEIYIVMADYPAAWRHGHLADAGGISSAVELLKRYGIPE